MVDLDEAAHDNHHHFATGQGVLEAVTEDEAEGKALPKLVGTGARARGLSNTSLIISYDCLLHSNASNVQLEMYALFLCYAL